MKRSYEPEYADEDIERNIHEPEDANDDTEKSINDADHDTNGTSGDDDGDDDVDEDDSFSDSEIRSENDEHAGIDLHNPHRLLAELICSKGMPPLAMLRFSKGPNPYVKLDYGTLKAECLQFYEEEKVKVKHIFKNMDGQISLSVTISRLYRRSGSDDEFMCLSAHFIDDKWKLRKWVLCFRSLWDEDDDCIPDATLKSIKDYEIEGKVSTFTLSSLHMYVDECIEMVKSQIQENKNLQLNGQLFHVDCCAAMFNNMADDAFKEISDIISKVRELAWTKSNPLWYLTTHKLKMALELEAMGEFSHNKIGDFYDIPSRDEWNKVEAVCKLTDKAYGIAKLLFEAKYPTANIYLYNLQDLRVTLAQESMSSCTFTSKVAKKMLVRLDNYWKNVFMVLGIASFLDPRYKMKYIEYLSPKREVSDSRSETALVLDAIHKLYNGYLENGLEKEDSIGVSNSLNEQEPSRSVEQGPTTPGWLDEYTQLIKIDGHPPKSDLDWYLEEPVVPWSADFNALKWWKSESPKYPTLSKMARDFLAIPMTVVASYDAYYTEPRDAGLDWLGSGKDFRNALMCTRSRLDRLNR